MHVVRLPPSNTIYRSYRSWIRSAPNDLDHEAGIVDLYGGVSDSHQFKAFLDLDRTPMQEC